MDGGGGGGGFGLGPGGGGGGNHNNKGEEEGGGPRRLMTRTEYLDQLATMDMGFALDNPLYTDREVLVRLVFWGELCVVVWWVGVSGCVWLRRGAR